MLTFETVLTQAHEACGPMEIDSALTAIQTLRNELQDARAAAASEQLKPLPGESVRDVHKTAARRINCLQEEEA